jgi:hypothetical protein
MSDSTTLVRDTVVASSNSGSAVNFSAGTLDVMSDLPASLQVQGPGSATVGNLALWNATGGNVLKDAGWSPRERLTAARSYYVATVANGGSDSNTGLASGSAFATLQKAIDTVAALDISIYTVTINVGTGTFTAGVLVGAPWVGTGTVRVSGNGSGNTIISTTSSDCFKVTTDGRLNVTALKVQTITSGNCFIANTGGSINVESDVIYGACAGIHNVVASNSNVNLLNNYTISGGANMHWYAEGGGLLAAQALTITLSSTPAFSTSFAYAALGGLVLCAANTFSGSATGARYNASAMGAVCVQGASTTYLPGNASGIGTNAGTTPFGFYG